MGSMVRPRQDRSGAEALAGFSVFLPRRGENIEHYSRGRSGANAVGNAAWRVPEIAGLHWDFLAALDAYAFPLQQYAPLFLGMAMDLSQ